MYTARSTQLIWECVTKHSCCREHQRFLNHREDFEGNQRHVCRQLQYITAICLRLAYIMMSSETLGTETAKHGGLPRGRCFLFSSLNRLHCNGGNIKQFCWRFVFHLEDQSNVLSCIKHSGGAFEFCLRRHPLQPARKQGLIDSME